jgi:hypothetical protein
MAKVRAERVVVAAWGVVVAGGAAQHGARLRAGWAQRAFTDVALELFVVDVPAIFQNSSF